MTPHLRHGFRSRWIEMLDNAVTGDTLRHILGLRCEQQVTGHAFEPAPAGWMDRPDLRWTNGCVQLPYAQASRCLRPARCHRPARTVRTRT